MGADPDETEPALSPAENFDRMFAAIVGSRTLRGIWRHAYGEDYPEEAEPFSYVTVTELEALASGLRIRPTETLVDLGCGAGGPGLWVAGRTGASLIGVDISAVALEHARARARRLGLDRRADFRLGEFAATGLADTSVDGVMSVDAFQILPDKEAAAREVARILRPGRRFAITTWEQAAPERARTYGPELDQRPAFAPCEILEAAGFTIELREEPAAWRSRELAVTRGVLAAEEALRHELGDFVAVRLVREAESLPRLLDRSTRVLVVARKPSTA